MEIGAYVRYKYQLLTLAHHFNPFIQIHTPIGKYRRLESGFETEQRCFLGWGAVRRGEANVVL